MYRQLCLSIHNVVNVILTGIFGNEERRPDWDGEEVEEVNEEDKDGKEVDDGRM